MSVHPFVSLILPIRNEADYIERSLRAVLEQDYPGKMEILVADGMSTDETRSIISKLAADSKHEIRILNNEGRVVPIGMNTALRQARGGVIIRVDGHCVIAPDYVRLCVEYIQMGKIDAVGGVMKSVGETDVAQAIALGMSSRFGVGNSVFRTLSSKTMLVDTVPFPAYTREIIERAGLYDEELVRNQDDEYNYRIRKIGGKIMLAADIHSLYFSRTSLKQLWKQFFQYGYWKVRVLQKHIFQMRLRQFIPPVFVSSLLFSLITLFFPASPFLLFALFIPLLYLFINVAISFSIARKHGMKFLKKMPLIFFVMHIGYGLGFMIGLIKFWNRWGDKNGDTPTWNLEYS